MIEQWAGGIGIGAGILPKAKLSPAAKTALALLNHDGTPPATFEFHWVWPPGLALPPHLVDLHSHLRTRVPALVTGRG